MANKLKNLQIDKLVAHKKTGLARGQIKDFLKKKKSPLTPSEFRTICDWYRRLGLYKDGLKFCDLHKCPSIKTLSSNDVQGLKHLYAAIFLSDLGCNQFPFLMADKIKLNNFSDLFLLGSVYLSQSRFDEALQIFLTVETQFDTLNSYYTKMLYISIADSYAGLEKYNKAIASIRPLLDQLMGISDVALFHQVLSEYYAQSAQFKEALYHNNQAHSFYSSIKSKTNTDYFFHIKWRAYILYHTGAMTHSKKLFSEVFKLFPKLKMRPEVLLDAKRLYSQVIKDHQTLICLSYYPLVSKNWYWQNNPKGKSLMIPSQKKTFIHLDLASQEFAIVKKSKFYWHPRMTKELELLGLLTTAGEMGINLYRIYEALWPEQFYSFLEFENRFKQLVHRLRSHWKIKLKIKNQTCFINSQNISTYTSQKELPQFLFQLYLTDKNKSFSATEVQKFYHLSSRNSSSLIMNQWFKSNWINRSVLKNQYCLNLSSTTPYSQNRPI